MWWRLKTVFAVWRHIAETMRAAGLGSMLLQCLNLESVMVLLKLVSDLYQLIILMFNASHPIGPSLSERPLKVAVK